ncbi:hypothetical protein CIB48_g8826 [Xylaria polymorpha]|nr:hypothetical protein CIB48_g8826 [Xylaria polymorpha]
MSTSPAEIAGLYGLMIYDQTSHATVHMTGTIAASLKPEDSSLPSQNADTITNKATGASTIPQRQPAQDSGNIL